MKKIFYSYCVVTLLVFFIIVLIYRAISLEGGSQEFYYLAKAFLQGQNYMTEKPGVWMDVITINDKHYWHLGPLPGLLIVPLIASIPNISIWSQSVVHISTIFTLGFLVYYLSRKHNYSKSNSLVFIYLFLLGSIFIQHFFINTVWFSSQVVTTLFILIYIHFSIKKNWLLAGMFLSGAIACRLNAGVGIIFALILLGKNATSLKDTVVSLLKIIIPILLVLFALGLYNFHRFGDFTNNGYYLINNGRWPESFTYELKTYGLFNPIYIPTNFYYYFIATVKPVLEDRVIAFGNTYMIKFPFIFADYPGVSFLTLSPLWLLAIIKKAKTIEAKAAKATAVCGVVVLLLYYWPGQIQLGSRYMLDVLPYLFIAILNTHQSIANSRWYRIALVVSVCLNLYLISVFFTLGQNIDWAATKLIQ